MSLETASLHQFRQSRFPFEEQDQVAFDGRAALVDEFEFADALAGFFGEGGGHEVMKMKLGQTFSRR
jgi:hypothetical protein